MKDKDKLVALLTKHNGDYYAAADASGERPDRLHKAWKKHTAGKKLDENGIRVDAKVDATFDNAATIRKVRNLQKTNQALRKEARQAIDLDGPLGKLADAIAKRSSHKLKWEKAKGKKSELHHEWLISDLHLGKKCAGYDSAEAARRLVVLGGHIVEAQLRDKPASTTFAFLGDLVENAHKHRDSRSGCDTETSEQVSMAITLLGEFMRRVLPKAGEAYVVGVSGNHENPLGHGSIVNNRGLAHLTSIIYSVLKGQLGNGVKAWVIPDGIYARHDWLGKKFVYEHGDAVQPSEASMQKQLDKRGRQANEMCDYYRQGDKHTATVINGGRLVCNGAFFSDREGTEFSGGAGYCSVPCQVGLTHSGGIITALSICEFE